MNHRLLSSVLGVALLLSQWLSPVSARPLPQPREGVELPKVLAPRAADTAPPRDLTGVPGAGLDWWSAAQAGIRQSEYEITWQERTLPADLPAAYQAPNRAHDLRTYFTPDGLRVIPRTFEGETPPWQWGLDGLGAAADLIVDGNRVEYRYQPGGELSGGWAVNDEQGLEMGFVLAAPDKDGTFQVEFSGSLTPRLADDGLSVLFMDADGQTVLHYGPFTALDGAGEPVPVELEFIGDWSLANMVKQ